MEVSFPRARVGCKVHIAQDPDKLSSPCNTVSQGWGGGSLSSQPPTRTDDGHQLTLYLLPHCCQLIIVTAEVTGSSSPCGTDRMAGALAFLAQDNNQPSKAVAYQEPYQQLKGPAFPCLDLTPLLVLLLSTWGKILFNSLFSVDKNQDFGKSLPIYILQPHPLRCKLWGL